MSMRCFRRDEHHEHQLLHEIRDLLLTLAKGQEIIMSTTETTQAELDDFITNTLTPALTNLETLGQSIGTQIAALEADYQAAVAGGTAPDLTPQLNELKALATRLQSDTAQATTLGNQLSTVLPAAAPATPASPAPVATDVKAT